MTIRPLSDKPTPPLVSSKSVQNNKAANTATRASEKSKDSIAITEVAKEITKAIESSKSTPVINQERVNAVKKSLEEGTYPINAERIAQKMIEMEFKQLDHNTSP